MSASFEYGAPVWMEPTGNAAIRWDGTPIVGYVESVGRKYYYVLPENPWYGKIKVDKQTNICRNNDCNQGFIVFPSREAFEQAQSRKVLLAKIRKTFGSMGVGNDLPYDALKDICDILGKHAHTN